MITIQIEHAITDFDLWKRAFDSDPIDRRGSGVIRHRVYSLPGDQPSVMIELDVADQATAGSVTEKLRALWASGAATPALADARPQVRLLELVEQLDS